jgi:hypothetical protein
VKLKAIEERKRMRAILRLTLAAALLAVTLPIASRQGIADDGWRDRSNYPSRVRVVQYPNPIDAINCARWGAWNVCFGKKPPVATYSVRGVGGGMCDTIKIDGLLCHNSVIGQKTCSIRAPAGCDAENEEQREIGRIVYQRCSLYPDGSDPPFIYISCPQNLVFER